jgi:hypothetical protein
MADIHLLDAKENLLHEFTRDAQGSVALLANTASEKATKYKLRTILGIDVTTKPTTRSTNQPLIGGD